MNKSGKSYPESEQNGNDNADRSTSTQAETTPPRDSTRINQIRELNDRLRTQGSGGMIVMTNGVAALGFDDIDRIFAAVAAFSTFTKDNDPWGEHDCAVLEVDGHSIIWKIDYFDRNRTYHSLDPSDAKVTVRVMTVMLAEEY